MFLSGKTWIAAALLAIANAGAVHAQEKSTLRETLRAKNLPIDAGTLKNLEKDIAGGAEFDDSNQFVTAYYLAGESDAVDSPLYVDRFDRGSGKWQEGKLESADSKEADRVDGPCLGSVMEIQEFGDYLLLDTHINPSAGCMLVLGRNLRLRASLYGWFLAGLPPSRVLYRRSEIHFAAVHPLEIAVYDLANGKDSTIFPQTADSPIRADLTKRLNAFFAAHQDWCREHNHPCDSKQVDSELQGDIAVNPQQDALAFVVSYETQVFQPGELQAPSGPNAVLYVYRHVSDEAHREFREIKLSGSSSGEDADYSAAGLKKYLTPERLDEIFSAK